MPSSSSDPSYPVPWSLVTLLARAGENVAHLLRSIGLDPMLLLDPGARLRREDLGPFVAAAMARLADPAVGLHLGELIQPASFHVVDYAMMCAPTWGDALASYARYKKLLGEARVTVTITGGSARLGFEPLMREVPRTQLVEVAFTHAICFGRWLTREPLRPRAVHLEFAAPAYVDEYRRIFGCPVRFAQPRSEVVLDPALLRLPVVFADAAARDTFVSHAEKLLGKLEGGRSAGEQVLAVLSERTPGGMPDIEQTARRLHTSTRTLQRKLREERLSFTALVDQARRSLVVEFLGNSRFSLGEISYLLGFADLSTFYRAFKRWMGTTPSAYRHGITSSVARE